jgi:hypothetical protein
MKSQSLFLNIFTIFNQIYNFHCLLLPSPNVSQQFKSGLVKTPWFAYAISSKMQKLSVQPNTSNKGSFRIHTQYGIFEVLIAAKDVDVGLLGCSTM